MMSRGKEVKELREKMGMNRQLRKAAYLLRLLNYRAEIECRIERVDK